MAKKPMPEPQQRQIKELREQGLSYTEIGKIVGCERRTVAYIINPQYREQARQRELAYNRQSRKTRIIKMDQQEIPEEYFNVHEKNWMVG